VLRVGVSSCRSSPCAHRALIASRPAFHTGLVFRARSARSRGTARARYVMPGVSVRERYEDNGPASSGPGTRSARGIARRRCASSRQARLGCRYAPRPGCRAWGSGTMASPAATRRSRLDFTARSLHPTHDRIGHDRIGTEPGFGCSDSAVIPELSLPPRRDRGHVASRPGRACAPRANRPRLRPPRPFRWRSAPPDRRAVLPPAVPPRAGPPLPAVACPARRRTGCRSATR
jgi:hypothetical protein